MKGPRSFVSPRARKSQDRACPQVPNANTQVRFRLGAPLITHWPTIAHSWAVVKGFHIRPDTYFSTWVLGHAYHHDIKGARIDVRCEKNVLRAVIAAAAAGWPGNPELAPHLLLAQRLLCEYHYKAFGVLVLDHRLVKRGSGPFCFIPSNYSLAS